jgi:hypothetical protein
LGDLAGEFSGASHLVHYGGDEVGGVECWKNDERTAEWARQQGAPYINASGGLNTTIMHLHFELAAAEAAVAAGAAPVFWMEAWMDGLGASPSASPIGKAFPKEAIFTAWSGPDIGGPVKAGYRALSNQGWYLDQASPGPKQQYAWQDYWQDFWAKEPVHSIAQQIRLYAMLSHPYAML